MRGLRAGLAVCAFGWALSAHAAAELEVCFNYGCAKSWPVSLAEDRLHAVQALLASANDAASERAMIAGAIGRLYGLAGEQTPIAADRAGNFLDDGVEGRMDCIDHSTNTTRFLGLMVERGWLRFHRLLEPARRHFAIFQHFSAVIEELEAPTPVALPDAPTVVPDYVAPMLVMCDCTEVLADIVVPAPVVEVRPTGHPGARFAVDSWFVDHGDPAVVLPLDQWLSGEGPNVQ
ncbi:hypothetical protein [Azoarcus sp. KH32C]|uniref:hypothetical protein n=1 Tax=Azoarcus sp. KH32C TaxID=748247 RepID=UPI0002386D65|nr:hypothetical protein [Azoarcus sp. KH32C]BAL23368.1 hypothetical protein AZKH_1032 [Azoarcus sp. KH32C]